MLTPCLTLINMYLIRLVFIVFLFFPAQLLSQQVKNSFRIFLSDNHNLQYEANYYTVTNDSLVISGLADYGKSRVDYLKRKLNPEEHESLAEFMHTFVPDTLNSLYFKDYSNLEYISPDHFPRVIDLELMNKGKSKIIRINNCFVPQLTGLFEMVNTLVPDEVKIKFSEVDFAK